MNATSPSKLNRITVFVYGATVYLLFVVTFMYAIGFVGNFVVPKSIDGGTPSGLLESILINAAFLALFAVQHTIMARPAFKAWWTQIIPGPAERSTFVLVTCLILIGMYWQWRPMPEVVWSVENVLGQGVLYTIFAAGWLLVLYASFCIDHFDLFGLRQVVLYVRAKEYTHPKFAMPTLYKLVRNPLMLGFLMAFWATPVMTRGHLLFALLTTGYIFVGIWFEERDLLKSLGESYRQYRERTPMILPLGQRPADAPDISAVNTNALTRV